MSSTLDSVLPVACILGVLIGLGTRIALTRSQGNRIYQGQREGRIVQRLTVIAILPLAGLVLFFMWQEYQSLNPVGLLSQQSLLQQITILVAAAFFIIVVIALVAQSHTMKHVTVFNNISRDIVTLALRRELNKETASFSVHKRLTTDTYYCAAGTIEVKWGAYRVTYIRMGIVDQELATRLLHETIIHVQELLERMGETVRVEALPENPGP